MSSLQGIPAGILEECISTPFPPMAGSALKIQVNLSQILSKIDQSKSPCKRLGGNYANKDNSCVWC